MVKQESRYGMTIPLPDRLDDHKEVFRELVELGYTDVWSSEANDTDGLTPLALAAALAPELRLGTAILPAFTRGPALMAQSAAAMACAAPGNFVLGIGTSSDVIVERWNGIPFEDPYLKARDTIRFLRRALTGENDSDSSLVPLFNICQIIVTVETSTFSAISFNSANSVSVSELFTPSSASILIIPT